MALITQAPAMAIISGNKITPGHLVLSDTVGMEGIMVGITPIIITTKTIIITTNPTPVHARDQALAIKAAAGQAITGIMKTTIQAGAAGRAAITSLSPCRATMTTGSIPLQEGIITQGRNSAIMAVATTTKDTNNILLADKPSFK